MRASLSVTASNCLVSSSVFILPISPPSSWGTTIGISGRGNPCKSAAPELPCSGSRLGEDDINIVSPAGDVGDDPRWGSTSLNPLGLLEAGPGLRPGLGMDGTRIDGNLNDGKRRVGCVIASSDVAWYGLLNKRVGGGYGHNFVPTSSNIHWKLPTVATIGTEVIARTPRSLFRACVVFFQEHSLSTASPPADPVKHRKGTYVHEITAGLQVVIPALLVNKNSMPEVDIKEGLAESKKVAVSTLPPSRTDRAEGHIIIADEKML
ncbi:hypothetical protein R3P38DRAFT_2810340 [Favolaschia claudopus]|uniref:Superoxide dismutase n=1 Tax=Favolaschia claudopus TaxID=2862362 RepID=A0AAV9ZB55_9AGAR